MYRLPSIILIFFGLLPILAQNPHGDELKIDCNQCHNAAGWEIDYNYIRFDHSKTDFNLEGAHDKTECKQCHTDLVLSNVPNQCASCHNDVHSMSVGNDCVQCHTSETWLVDNIPELHEANGFPLVGSHSNLSCVDCHFSETNLRFDNIGNECISCHQDDYLATQSPNHTELGFSTDCLECHNPLGTGWDSENILHDFFPLTLGHDIDDCTQCHTTDNYSDASPECISCHQENYDASFNPDHQTLSLSTNCVVCHTTNLEWMPASFDNHNDYYELNGAHAVIANDCATCHNGDYINTPNTCIGCHQTDYDNTNDPNHSSAQFPTDCIECHNETAWEPSTLDHDGQYFPIYSGDHQGEWNSCLECHINPNDYSVYNCFSCHEENETNDIHDHPDDPDFNGYAYESTACVACHPNP